MRTPVAAGERFGPLLMLLSFAVVGGCGDAAEGDCPPGKHKESTVGNVYIEDGACVPDDPQGTGQQNPGHDSTAAGIDLAFITCADGNCPAEQPFCNAAGVCVMCLDESHCPIEGDKCSSGLCLPVICEPGDKICNGNTVQTCNTDGTEIELLDCSPAPCVASQCVPCVPGEVGCNGDNVAQCKANGSHYEIVTFCPEGRPCLNGQCISCYPGEGHCIGTDAYQCAANGSGWEFVKECPDGKACVDGYCMSFCLVDPKSNADGNIDCTDTIACTVDSCVEGVGCHQEPDDTQCNDGTVCTTDICDVGQGCTHEAQDLLCDDDDPCTKDVCHPQLGCSNTPTPQPEVDEVCGDLVDNDCDGQLDESCCFPGEIQGLVPCPLTPMDFVWVLDKSGSMDSSDPFGFMEEGLKQVIPLMKAEDRATIVLFDDFAWSLGPLSSGTNTLLSLINQSASVPNDGGTNILGGLEMAMAMQEEPLLIIWLLTDGIDNTYSPALVKAQAESLGIIIVTMGLGPDVDTATLSATATSDGAYYPIAQASDIPGVYEQAFLEVTYLTWQSCTEQGWKLEQGTCYD